VRDVNASVALLAVLFAATNDPAQSGQVVRARLEPASHPLGGARFVLRARLESPPDVAALGRAGVDTEMDVRIDARLIAKAEAASCELPGAIFRDGFEHP
jgi:hypothetical protein